MSLTTFIESKKFTSMFLPCLSALLNTDHYMTFFSYIFEKKKKERKTDRKKERSIIKTNRNKRRKE